MAILVERFSTWLQPKRWYPGLKPYGGSYNTHPPRISRLEVESWDHGLTVGCFIIQVCCRAYGCDLLPLTVSFRWRTAPLSCSLTFSAPGEPTSHPVSCLQWGALNLPSTYHRPHACPLDARPDAAAAVSHPLLPHPVCSAEPRLTEQPHPGPRRHAHQDEGHPSAQVARRFLRAGQCRRRGR